MTLESRRVPVEGHSLLSNLVLGTRVNVIGVVKSYSPPRRCRGTDWLCSFQITDPSLNGKVTVIMFRAQYTEIPEASIGSIFVGTGLKVNHYMNSPQLIAYKLESTCTIINDDFKGNKFSHVMHNRVTEIMAYSEHLRSWWNNLEILYAGRQESRKLITIADIRPNIFFDTIAEIVEIYRLESTTELYITDYTRNELLSNNCFTSKLPDGLDVCNVFQISLWDEHIAASQNFRIGMYVYLQNIQPKHNNFNHFQGVIHGDPETRRIRVTQIEMSSSGVIELKKRKELVRQKYSNFAKFPKKVCINSNIVPKITRVIDCHVKPTSINDIKKYKEVPCKFLTRGRIVDFGPDFEKFIRPFCAACDEVIFPKHEGSNQYHDCPHDTTFIYDFFLLVEDKFGERLSVLVFGPDAVKFLKELRPTSVMENESSRQIFQNLITKLLGNVLDHDQPTEFFDFCVESYYVPDYGERLYKLTNTILEI